jgi:hypothetical protein
MRSFNYVGRSAWGSDAYSNIDIAYFAMWDHYLGDTTFSNIESQLVAIKTYLNNPTSGMPVIDSTNFTALSAIRLQSCACATGTFFHALTSTCQDPNGPCDPGKYRTNGSCVDCLAGSFCNGTGQIQGCPPNSNSSAGAYAITSCICKQSGFLVNPINFACESPVSSVQGPPVVYLAMTPFRPYITSDCPTNSTISGWGLATAYGNSLPLLVRGNASTLQSFVSLDRTKLQYLTLPPLTLGIHAKGGLTVLILVRFTGSIGALIILLCF